MKKLKILFIIILFLFVFELHTSYAEAGYYLKINGPAAVDVGTSIHLACNSFLKDSPNGDFPSIGVGGVTDKVTWTSSDPTVATVTDAGLVTGVKAGTAIIKAEHTEGTGADSVTVSAEHSITVVGLTDVSNVNFSIEKQGNEFYNYYLKISGLTRKEGYDYFAFVSNSPTLSADILADPYESTKKFFINSNGTQLIKDINTKIEQNGDIYVWLYQHNNNNMYIDTASRTQVLISAKKVERPQLGSLGLRLQAYFFNEDTSLFVKEFPVSDGRKFHIKIGNITNIEILKSIRDGKAGSFASLLNYAKSDSNPFYDSAISYNGSTTKYSAIAPNLPIVNDGFYYVYMYLEDENGKYYPLEDIGLYQGLVSEVVGKNLTDYYTEKDKFNWDALGSETPGTQEPTPNPNPTPNPTPTPTPTPNPSDPTATKIPIPNTGKGTLIIGFIVILVSGIFAYIKSQKYREIK